MKQIVNILILLSVSSCATTYNDFAQHPFLSDRENEAILFGNIQVKYNDKNYNDKCSICFSGAESGCYKLPKSGDLLMYVHAGETTLKSVNCLDVVEYQVYLKSISFKTLAQQKNYIGQFQFDWKNEKTGFQWDKAFNFFGAIKNEKESNGKITFQHFVDLEKDQLKIERGLKEEDQLPTNSCEVTTL